MLDNIWFFDKELLISIFLLFESKCSGARTKTKAIIVNVITPYIFHELLKYLKDANSVTLTIDSPKIA